MGNRRRLLVSARLFATKLILEVFGGGGAVWGFSEALGLRTSRTQEFWRVIALAVASVFLFRWLFQLRDHLSGNESTRLKEEISMMSSNFENDDLALDTDLATDGTDYGSGSRVV